MLSDRYTDCLVDFGEKWTLTKRRSIHDNSLHYSSEEGLQVALTYMTVIETVKMLGMNAKEFLVRAWREVIYGKNDMESLLQPVSVCK